VKTWILCRIASKVDLGSVESIAGSTGVRFVPGAKRKSEIRSELPVPRLVKQSENSSGRIFVYAGYYL